MCHVLRRGETLSEETLSALMEWLAEAWGRGGGRSKRSAHLESLQVTQALAVKGETGRLAGERGQGPDTGHTTVRDQQNERAEKKTEIPPFNVA